MFKYRGHDNNIFERRDHRDYQLAVAITVVDFSFFFSLICVDSWGHSDIEKSLYSLFRCRQEQNVCAHMCV